MTTPMYTDKEYLHERFTRLEGMIEDVRGDVSEVKSEVRQLQSDVVGNRVELAKSGVIALAITGAAEFFRRMGTG